ncbi:MAG TPA: penicillin-binding protein 1C [Thermoanaerobaculia bacterium]|nr:penicillin-binding protein 1C [Thermoanaerobaculia bacterium]
MKKIVLWVSFVAIATCALRFAPLPSIPTETTPTIVDRNGVILYEPLGAGGTRSAWLSEIPHNVERATIAAEDKRFYLHPGIDPLAVVRAVAADIRHLRVVQGGSTITQQVAKLMLRRNSRWQKLHEAVVALQLEARYSKKEILGLYLNLAPYGEQTVGVARASQRYFGCDPEQLTVAQAAYLAALPQRPSAKNVRYRAVLQRMHASHADFAEKLNFDKGKHPLLAPHFVERVRAVAHGSRIQTTLDAKLQREILGIITAAKPELLRHGAHSVAVAVLDNRSGDWLAWEGSGDYFGTDFGGAIDGVVTPRQPGSALKPFTYALAFESGFTPATVLDDVPSHFPTAEEGVVYTPRNYDGRYRGPLRARLALAGSENVPAVQLLSKLGPASLLRFLRAEGFEHFDRTADYYGLGLTLGDAEVTLEELVRAYATFARGGVTVSGKRLVSQRTAFWITDILSDPSAREYIFGSGGALDFPFPVAVKTGTSQAYRDNWTIGYTRDVTVGVWVGNFDLSTLRNSSGVTGAGPVFHAVMLAAAKDHEQIVERPGDLERVPVCALTGLRPSTACPEVDNEWMPSDAAVVFCAHPRQTKMGVARATKPTRLIQNPADGATFLIDPTLRREFQALRLRASGDARWSVDGKRVAQEWPLEPGRHIIAAVDERGRRDTVTITVR